MAEHAIARAALVQPMYPGEENSYVADCAASQPDRLAAVCLVDPRKTNAADRLEYWVKERGCRGLRLRPRSPDEAALFAHPSTEPLWARAQRLGIVISILMGPEHLPALDKRLERFPELPVVIDHLGHPDVTGGVSAPAFQYLLQMARHPQLFVKLSGFYYIARQPYPYPDCRPLVQALYEHYGPRRLLWGSDFPHVLLKTDYGRTVHLLPRMGLRCSQTELDWIMGENGRELYWP
jgi:predicted TIM-barrel fold metal-dependent hydrolase